MNVPLLRRIQRQIDKAPKRFQMDFCESQTEYGTAFCIAGWACELSGDKESWYKMNKALKFLDLKDEHRDKLFHKADWPHQFKCVENTSERAASLAIARIDHFIKTEGRE